MDSRLSTENFIKKLKSIRINGSYSCFVLICTPLNTKLYLIKMKNIALIVLIAFFMSACGGGSTEAKKEMKEEPKKEMAAEEPAAEESASASDADGQVVVIEASDQQQFDLKEIRVKAGGTVTLTLKHTGAMAKVAMGHNFVLLKSGVDMNTFAIEAISAMDQEYIPADGKDVIAYTKLLGGGEEDTITFDVPEKGTYDFLCSFPGHFALMQGKFIVE
ncbi:MAG: azurin [Bacteroidota bacterium]